MPSSRSATTEAQAWLGSLNDLRLTIGSRLEITEDRHESFADLAEDDPRFVLFHVYDWLTFLQETLVHAARRPRLHPPGPRLTPDRRRVF